MSRSWAPWQNRAWQLINASTVPLWLLMILAPRSGVTGRAVGLVAPVHLALGATYGVFLARAVTSGGERASLSDGASMARGLSTADGMLAGWTHYLTFDLFVGVWIHRTAADEGIDARVALLLTWWAGPLGLTLFTWQRHRARTRAA